ncbi:MAG TPA: gamma-glutamyl-gamma-aminobutyrate hydrolase family protein, partial [Lapillicoccus sp.]|nr:gamma-glutamyl-gamma-aminobutyrate hydrolase family protein [Lapillicoccus sp.]
MTPSTTRILVVDNYDSFVFTIVGYLQQLGAECEVVRNDAVAAADGADFDGVLVSPGPGTPEEAGVSMAMIEACGERAQPMLGVCLGHQALGVVMGATVGRAPELLHGKTSQVHHDGTGVLAGLPSPFTATRYHSLTIDPATRPD